MIPIPPPVCIGQKITVDGYNQLLDVMRSLQPIGGAGILLEETANGIIFKLAEPPQSVSTGAFNHRWKVSLIGNETDGYKLHIAPGDLYLITDTGAVREPLIIPTNIAVDEERGGWLTEVSNGAPVAIYRNPDGKYVLHASTPTDGETLIYVIASIVGPSSSNPTPIVTQLLYQDLYYWQGGSGAEPEPFEVRYINDGWYIYAPTLHVVDPGLVDVFIDAEWNYFYPLDVNLSGWISLASLLPSLSFESGSLYFIYNPFAPQGEPCYSFSAIPSGPNAVLIGQFSAGSWKQENKGTILYRLSFSPPCTAYEDRYGNISLVQDIPAHAVRCWIGRTFYLQSLEMGGRYLGSQPVYQDGFSQLLVAGKGVEIAFHNPVVKADNTLVTRGAAIYPVLKITDDITVATQEERTSVVSVGVTSPSEETEQGEVYGHTRTTYSWVFKPSDNEFKTTLLYTEVEEANTTSTYTDASGLTE
jgi:hypothetical protein